MTDPTTLQVLDGLVLVLLVAVIAAWHVGYTWAKRGGQEDDDD